MRIDGTVALVTGGASGLGLATVERLLTDGASVVLVDLPRSDGNAVADRLGDRARFAAADVADEEQVTAALDIADDLGRRIGGQLRTIVNCAGAGTANRVVGRAGPYPLEEFVRLIMINLVGTFNVTRLGATRMNATEAEDGERGVVINTASAAAFEGQVGQAGYAAAKGGVTAMTLPLARDLANRLIRVVTISPGHFETPLLAAAAPTIWQTMSEQVPHPRRLGRPAEFADLVAHVIGNQMLNGEVIRLDGALRLPPR